MADRISFSPLGSDQRAAGQSADSAPTPANALAFVAELRDAEDLVDGEEVAQVQVRAADGASQTLTLRAGEDVSEARGGLPGELPANHRRVEAADEQIWVDPDGS